jgi:hypothetical protein
VSEALAKTPVIVWNILTTDSVEVYFESHQPGGNLPRT